jgi:sulfur carrier protein
LEITISIYTEGVRRTTLNLEEALTYEELLERFHINPETVIVLNNGMPQPLDEFVSEGDIRILRIVSGG